MLPPDKQNNTKQKLCLFELFKIIVIICVKYLWKKTCSTTADIFKFLTLFWILKLLSVSKFIERISGSREQTTTSDNNSEQSASKAPDGKLKSAKARRGKKSYDEPTFSTSLKTPIEDIIEESVAEEEHIETVPTTRKTKPLKNKSKSNGKNISGEDTIGYSFFGVKPRGKPKKLDDNPKKSKRNDTRISESESVVEDYVGFSFLPVTKRNKSKSDSDRKITKEDLNLSTKSDDGYKSSIIEHYQKRNKRQFVEPAAQKIAVKPLETNPQYSFGKLSTNTEVRESRKVDSSISYANVVSQKFPQEEQLDNSQSSLHLESKQNNLSSPNSIDKINLVENYFETDLNASSQESNILKASLKEFAEKYFSSQAGDFSTVDQGEGENNIQNINKEFNNSENLSDFEGFQVVNNTEESLLNSSSKAHNLTINSINKVEIHTESGDEIFKSSTNQKSFERNLYDSGFDKKLIRSVEDFKVEREKLDSTIDSNQQTVKPEETNLDNYVEKFEFKLNQLIKNQTDFEILDKISQVDSTNKQTESSNIDKCVEKFEIKLDQLITTDLEVLDKNRDDEPKKEIEYFPISEIALSQIAKLTNSSEPLQPQKSASICSKSNESTMSSPTQVRVLTLNDQEHQDSTLYRIEKYWVIQFRFGPSLLGRKVSLFCNYPKTATEFSRSTYQLLNWQQDEGCKHADDTALYTQLTAKISGSFHYYFTYEGEPDRQGSGFFLVDPVLTYGDKEDLPLDCVQCQTVLAKGLGSLDTWERKLRVAKESGYNMVHFTPIQELGASNSGYSLSEQLKLNPTFNKENGEAPTFDEIQQFISKIRKDWRITSICDIVLNHTANESEWLKDHPETTYNCANCPYLRPAYLLDAALYQFSLEIKKGVYEDRGIPPEVNSEEHLKAISYHFRNSVLNQLNLPELFTCDITKLVEEFLTLSRKHPPTAVDKKFQANEELKLLQDVDFRRLETKVDMDLALKLYNVFRTDCFDEETRFKRCAEDFKSKLEDLNKVITDEINNHLTAAIDNVLAGIRYFRVQPDGPRFKEISVKTPLVYRYFTDLGFPTSIKEHEELMYSPNGRFLMAHNGWVMNADPLRNFAAPGSNIYIRRELIAWGDSVKLRYGDKPEDCPFLWQHMRSYVEQTARIFDGVRLDNCHSTPIPVAEYLLDCARRVRPDLYVVAELFTNSDMTDNIFVNRLGITSLIREAMSAWDSHEQGRLVYRYGGCPVGSFHQPSIRPLVPSIAHALFLDLTHDNPSPVEKRSVFDLLPSTALVNMAYCGSGSNRGYDELVPHHIHVVDETRQYTEWTDDDNLALGNSRFVTKKSGIIAAKKALNDLHFQLAVQGYNQVYVDQMDPDIVAVTRHCPETHQSFILVAFTAFSHPVDNAQRGIKPLRVEGVLDEIVLEATLNHVSTKSGGSKYTKTENFVKDNKWINGLSEYQVQVKQHIKINESMVFDQVESQTPNVTQLNFKNFKPGSIVVVKVSLPEDMRQAIGKVRSLVNQFSMTRDTELISVVNKLSLADLNRILYRCGQEEKDEGHGFDTYNIPNFGTLVYSGLQGFMSLLASIRPSNDLGHPMCANLRDGNWMIEYIWKRLKLDEGTKELGEWLEINTKPFSTIPRYLVPCYFDLILTGLYVIILEQCYKLMSDFVKNGSTFVKGLSLGSVQFAGYIKSADLPTLSPNLSPPKPPTRVNNNGEVIQTCVTLSAGLPHFAVGYTRNWGRDTFIALRGLLILTGRYDETRQHILGYAACLRHGLIPNLLDGGRNSRFNCRDAVWWWLHCIKEYVDEAPNGLAILSDKVSRIFPQDDSPPQLPGAVDQPLYDVIQEALRVHFQGLVFRERNAGRQIDEQMTDHGFNNQIGIHPETGFVFGGNEWNCGTWMDKMGSSDKAGNKGKPATPRDGSAVELVGLSKSVVSWLWKLNQKGAYPYDGVERTHKNGTTTKWTFKEWSDKIQANFEKYFWVNQTPVPGELKPELVNKRGIYKDCYGATQHWTDYQLRCNFPIAMVVAPELFDPKHAWVALQQAEKHLLGPLGMKTLDPDDWAYNGDYDNSNDSNDFKLANGFNYHQGPEWVWPTGFFLRAKLHFAAYNSALKDTVNSTKITLARHFVELQTSVWRGLPELTNTNGAYCSDSSRTQAWSMACILEVLNDLQKIEAKQEIIVN